MYLFEHSDFSELISQTAQELKIPFAFVEKDYWVTYVLYRLQKAKVGDFIFKGGTSLTKAWGLLDRFSEDIDLLFIQQRWSNDKKRRRLKAIQQLVSKFEGLMFDQKLSESRGHYRTDCYRYEIKQNTPSALLPYIKLEMGYRGGDSPSGYVEIQSYMGKLIEDRGSIAEVEDIKKFKIKILDVKRTFSEKIFAIYSAHLKNEVAKYFRHYYDVYKLLQLDDVVAFLGTPEHSTLKKHIAEMSKEFFSTKIPDDLDFSKSTAFKKSDELVNTLERALKDAADLFYAPAPSAKEILTKIEHYSKKF